MFNSFPTLRDASGPVSGMGSVSGGRRRSRRNRTGGRSRRNRNSRRGGAMSRSRRNRRR